MTFPETYLRNQLKMYYSELFQKKIFREICLNVLGTPFVNFFFLKLSKRLFRCNLFEILSEPSTGLQLGIPLLDICNNVFSKSVYISQNIMYSSFQRKSLLTSWRIIQEKKSKFLRDCPQRYLQILFPRSLKFQQKL